MGVWNMKCCEIAVVACCFAGCASRPSTEARAALCAMAEAQGAEIGAAIKEVETVEMCKALDSCFSQEELEELRVIFSDRQVRQLMQTSPVDMDALDSRIKELSHSDALLKFGDADLRRRIFPCTERHDNSDNGKERIR